MELRTQSNPQRTPRINGVKIKSTTKVFDLKSEAEDYSMDKKSYVFNVVKVEKIDNKLTESHYGYGVPK